MFRVSGRVLVFLTLSYSGLKILLRFFLGSFYGVFLFCVAFYWLSFVLFEFRPYGIQEMLLWFDSAPIEMKASLLSSLVTVLGFIVAFATASYNWRSQFRSQMKAQAESEIDHFLTEFCRLSIDLDIYVRGLIRAYDACQGGKYERAEFLVRQCLYKADEAQNKRDDLVKFGSEIHRLHGKHANLLKMLLGVESRMEDVEKSIHNITDKAWFMFPVEVDDGNLLDVYVEDSDLKGWGEFCEVVRVNLGIVSASQGYMKAMLLSDVVDVNIWHFINMYKDSKKMVEIFDDMGDKFRDFKRGR